MIELFRNCYNFLMLEAGDGTCEEVYEEDGDSGV